MGIAARGIFNAEQNIGDCHAANRSWLIGVHHGRRSALFSVYRLWLRADQNDNDGHASGADGVEQWPLRAREFKRGAIARLADNSIAHQSCLVAKHQDRDIGALRRFERLWNVVA